MLSWFDRGRYYTQQAACAAVLVPLMRLWHLGLGARPGAEAPTRASFEALEQRMRALLAADLRNVEEGWYPAGRLFDLPFTDLLRRLPDAALEPLRVRLRIARGAWDDLPGDVDPDAYPAYYRRTFHWQTDGWLSERSAFLYDSQVEAIFAGAGDAMRRQALPPLVRALRRRGAARPRVLDVACGTGRFLAHLHAALPEARLQGLDLSPPYLARARERFGAQSAVSFVHENAERMPFRAGWFDAAASIFLFHELPRRARERVAAETFRVLAPGGTFVVCDAAQLVDSPELAPFLQGFPQLYHEPFFEDYTAAPLETLLEAAGFEVAAPQQAFLSKIVVAHKPAA